jgi:hypothetical protein
MPVRRFGMATFKVKLTITERETGETVPKGAEAQGQEPSESVADSQVEFGTGRYGVHLLVIEGNQASGGRQDVSGDTVSIAVG